jgi:hypothetical protein
MEVERVENKVRLIAFYLPQFHPIPENDLWWGKGFTEWTNVARARPLFPGHYQPNIPADLGFYDLRVPETRVAQAEMAHDCGIEGFCYWHYWFAGKRLLERPFNEVLRSGEPDYPFCLAWANQSWSGIWHGAPDRILIEQTYPGRKDYEDHFYALLEAFCDQRYIAVDRKPVFAVLEAAGLPEPERFTDHWRELALKEGFAGVYFIELSQGYDIEKTKGFDALVFIPLNLALRRVRKESRGLIDRVFWKLFKKDRMKLRQELLSRPLVYSYEDVAKYTTPPLRDDYDQYPCVIPNWDHTPRSGRQGVVLHHSKPALFGACLKEAVVQVAHREYDKRIVFIKSWNEWAEGNYLEPDQRYGKGYLDAIKEVIGQ